MSEFVWNNMRFNSADEMNLAKEIPGVYLDRWNDAGHVAEAVIASDWLAKVRAASESGALRRMARRWREEGIDVEGFYDPAYPSALEAEADRLESS